MIVWLWIMSMTQQQHSEHGGVWGNLRLFNERTTHSIGVLVWKRDIAACNEVAMSHSGQLLLLTLYISIDTHCWTHRSTVSFVYDWVGKAACWAGHSADMALLFQTVFFPHHYFLELRRNNITLHFNEPSCGSWSSQASNFVLRWRQSCALQIQQNTYWFMYGARLVLDGNFSLGDTNSFLLQVFYTGGGSNGYFEPVAVFSSLVHVSDCVYSDRLAEDRIGY